MEVVIIFLIYLLVSFVATWRFVPLIKEKQWDIKSARILLAVFIGIAGFLILSLSVYFIDGQINPNKASLTMILGTIMVFITIAVSLFIMHFIRKMKYMQVTFNIPGSVSDNGSLSEKSMTCLVDRNQVLNIQKIFKPIQTDTKKVESIELNDEDEQ